MGKDIDVVVGPALGGIIFASDGKDFSEKARDEALKLRDEINLYRH